MALEKSRSALGRSPSIPVIFRIDRAFFLAVAQNNASVLSRRSNNEALRRNDLENSPNDRVRSINIQEKFLGRCRSELEHWTK